jgi:Sigma-70 region 2
VAAPEVPPVDGTQDQAPEPPAGFEHFYLREYRGVVELAYALSGNRAGAEDIAQEAFLRAHRDWQRVGCPRSSADVVSGTGSYVGSRASRITPGHHLHPRA